MHVFVCGCAVGWALNIFPALNMVRQNQTFETTCPRADNGTPIGVNDTVELFVQSLALFRFCVLISQKGTPSAARAAILDLANATVMSSYSVFE